MSDRKRIVTIPHAMPETDPPHPQHWCAYCPERPDLKAVYAPTEDEAKEKMRKKIEG